uniref:Uncharacterized protein n=1 Tax=Chenopodium quinoa TaxID=63459 RepID=A0A803MX34_CHEQI
MKSKKYVEVLLLTIGILVIVFTASTTGENANDFPISNIMLESDTTLVGEALDDGCKVVHEFCNKDEDCCPNSECVWSLLYSTCSWCPGAGKSCGFFTGYFPCCRGFTCDSWWWGTCH